MTRDFKRALQAQARAGKQMARLQQQAAIHPRRARQDALLAILEAQDKPPWPKYEPWRCTPEQRAQLAQWAKERGW